MTDEYRLRLDLDNGPVIVSLAVEGPKKFSSPNESPYLLERSTLDSSLGWNVRKADGVIIREVEIRTWRETETRGFEYCLQQTLQFFVQVRCAAIMLYY